VEPPGIAGVAEAPVIGGLETDDCVDGDWLNEVVIGGGEMVEVLDADPVSTVDPTLNVETNALGAGALNVSVVGLLQFTFTPSDSVPQHAHESVV
jgi:hypothetical protein